jgi:hypothetical protein
LLFSTLVPFWAAIAFSLGRSRSQGLAIQIINQLHIDICIAPEHRQTWLLGSTFTYLPANAEADVLPSCCFNLCIHIFYFVPCPEVSGLPGNFV